MRCSGPGRLCIDLIVLGIKGHGNGDLRSSCSSIFEHKICSEGLFVGLRDDEGDVEATVILALSCYFDLQLLVLVTFDDQV